ncbi:hypothetical protein SNE40_020175 [Patella caerulea]|uniref:ERCC4 domain-containing protein n=1 Tax=Patella caerulea TaxID=87958 RepID=A0AAN8G9X8_PATCE
MNNLNEFISHVLAVCPDAEEKSVRLDLSLTGSVETTINRILDGTAVTASLSEPCEDLSTTDINSDSSFESTKNIPKINSVDSRVNVFPEESVVIREEKNTDINSNSEDELPELNYKKKTSDTLLVLNTCIDNKDDNDIIEIDNIHSSILKLNNNNSKFETNKVIDTNMTDNIDNSPTYCMSSDNENEISIHTYPTQKPKYNKTNTCYSHESSGEELPDIDIEIPSLAERCKMKSRSVLEMIDNSFEPPSVNNSPSYNSVYSEDSVSTTCTTISDINDGQATKKRKRTPEEIAESKRHAINKKEERQRLKDEKKAQKDREAQMRKIESENKKSFRPGDCLKKITVSIDPGIINTNGNGGPIFKAFDDLGVKCETIPQSIPNSVIWKREIIECSQDDTTVKHTTEEDMLIMIPLEDFIAMIKTYSQKQKGDISSGVTLTEFIQSLQCAFNNHLFTFFVHGVEKYFSDLKLIKKQKHKEAVMETGTSDASRSRRRKMAVDTIVTQLEIEEAMVETQLLTSCMIKFMNNSQQIADLIRTFTKAVAEKPAKQGRLENVFNFLEEGTAGVKVDKNGQGLLKVFKHQLMQFKNLGPDMADAILGVYQSPRSLLQAYAKCQTEKERERLLENIMVRRGGGVLATNRRVGKEMSRRIFLFLTCRDPNFVIK